MAARKTRSISSKNNDNLRRLARRISRAIIRRLTKLEKTAGTYGVQPQRKRLIAAMESAQLAADRLWAVIAKQGGL